jgi:hypothetical protein
MRTSCEIPVRYYLEWSNGCRTSALVAPEYHSLEIHIAQITELPVIRKVCRKYFEAPLFPYANEMAYAARCVRRRNDSPSRDLQGFMHAQVRIFPRQGILLAQAMWLYPALTGATGDSLLSELY